MSAERLYRGFVRRYFRDGTTRVPGTWPKGVRKRCRFFLRMLESSEQGPSLAERSVVSMLEDGSTRSASGRAGEEEARVAAERYSIEGELGRGGMGRVLLALDRDLRRRVAVKVLLGPRGEPGTTSRFLDEAQATAQLEHPNIPPVYDVGVDAAGSPFFTMRWIRGRDLKEILATRPPELSLVRLVQILQQAAMGVELAASRGVVHRDLKPRNIMVGEYGEVLVVDWGLAKLLGPAAGRAGGGIATERARRGLVTIDGAVQGSVAYMAPEQARGEVSAIDARTDVFGLGAVLYEILTGSPPYPEEDAAAALARARRGDVVPSRERAPDRAIPPALDAACSKALAPRKEDRFQTARELHDALQAFIEGTEEADRRAAEAKRLRRAARRLEAGLRRARAAASRLRGREARLRARVRDHDPEARKRPLWRLAERAAGARAEASALFNRVAAAYLAVLSVTPEDPASRRALADLFHDRLLEADATGDAEAAGLYEELVAQYDDGRHRAELDGPCTLRLESDPPGAEAVLHRFEEKGLVLEAGRTVRLGRTPLEVPLERGSYLAVLRTPGHHEARYPFLLGRRARHEVRVLLHPRGSIPEGFLQVPGGESIVGGTSRDFPCLARQRVLVGEIFVSRFPVTFGEYCRFLDRFEGSERELREHLPQFARERYVARTRSGRWAPIRRLDRRTPVFAIPRASMLAYCRWLGRRIGKRVRLPTEVEWERCVRGADGRLFPWGNGFDWAFTKGGLSRPGDPFPEPAGAFRRDESVFGIRDLAGGVRELCDGWYGEEYRPCRGGSFFNPSPVVFRADCRMILREGRRTPDVGFRVCWSEGTGGSRGGPRTSRPPRTAPRPSRRAPGRCS
ncbi:MAG: protein kinase [Planctomycetes bacterium]|nr:protein kinase [Planctomycetota bacterium]